MNRKALASMALFAMACGAGRRPAAVPPSGPALRHPGILVDDTRLDAIRAHLAAGQEPWTTAMAEVRKSRWASLDWQPRPRPIVECGPYSTPNHGCNEERDDAVAAYTHALLFALSGEARHARKGIEILNAWSAVVTDHTLHNAPLQSAWAASIFPRAAELLRHGGAGWEAAEIERFETMLTEVYLPEFAGGSAHTNGNWELSMIEAILAIAVFTDDRPLFERGVGMWRARVPAYFYLKRDGDRPVPAPGGYDDTAAKVVKRWYGQTELVDGLCQETCRDFGHTQYGLAAALNAAETARLQGVDLYGAEAPRLTAAMELHADYLLGKPVPGWLCNGNLKLGRVLPTWDLGYNHYAGRAAQRLPATRRLIEEHVRAHPTGVNHHMAWETLTHAEAGWAGAP